MNDDLGFHDLEQRLRREAETISSRDARCGSAIAIGAEFRRRRTRRRRQGGLAAAALMACGVIGYAGWKQTEGEPPHPVRVVQTPGAATAAGADSQRDDEARPSPLPAPVVHESPAFPGDASEAPAPFLITVAGEDEQEVIAVGVYIPPRVERVNLRDLPPLEQAAVRRVLGLDEPAEKPTI
jgi:hypothetical protein